MTIEIPEYVSWRVRDALPAIPPCTYLVNPYLIMNQTYCKNDTKGIFFPHLEDEESAEGVLLA